MLYNLWFLSQEKVYDHYILPEGCVQTECLHILKVIFEDQTKDALSLSLRTLLMSVLLVERVTVRL